MYVRAYKYERPPPAFDCEHMYTCWELSWPHSLDNVYVDNVHIYKYIYTYMSTYPYANMRRYAYTCRYVSIHTCDWSWTTSI